MGRVTAQAIVDSTGTEIYPRNFLLTEEQKEILIERGVDQIKVRSVLTCEERHGFCASCFGRDSPEVEW